MANPLKILTQLSASKEAQFAEVVEMQKQVTLSGAEAHLKVTGGAEISGSGALKIAGASQLGSTLAVQGDANLASKLDVKGASALSGALGVVGVATLQDQIVVAGAADFNSSMDVQGDLNLQSDLDVAGYVKAVGEISGSAALNIGGQAHIAGAAQFDQALNVDGAADFDSTMDVAGNVTMQASASLAGDLDVNGLADIAGNLDVHGNATVYGNLEVKGTMTTIESTTVTVADANIQLATVASPTDATADGAGITILGATNKTFQWNNDGNGFTSSEDMNLAAGKVYKINGEEVLSSNSMETRISSVGAASNIELYPEGNMLLTGEVSASAGLDVAGAAHFANQVNIDGNINALNGAIKSLDSIAYDNMGVVTDLSDPFNTFIFRVTQAAVSSSLPLDLDASAHIAGAVDMDSTLNVDGAADFQAAAAFHDAVSMDAALNLSGSAFVNIATPVVSGKYNVNDAIRALDAKAGQQASDINNSYAALRFLESKNFDANGMAAFTASNFPVAAIEQVTVDVLVQAGGSGPWTNDLVSVQVKPAGSYVGFEISAPAMGASDKVRIIAVKESGSLA